MSYKGNRARYYEHSKFSKPLSYQDKSKIPHSNVNKFKTSRGYENQNHYYSMKNTMPHYGKPSRKKKPNSTKASPNVIKNNDTFHYYTNISESVNTNKSNFDPQKTNEICENLEKIRNSGYLNNTKDSFVNFAKNINSSNNKRTTMNADNEINIPGKKQKVTEQDFSDLSNLNTTIKPKLQDLKSHQINIDNIKDKINIQKATICKIKEEFRVHQRLLIEMKLKKKIAIKKMKKLYYDIFNQLLMSNDKNEEDCVIIKEDLSNIIRIESSSESENDSDSLSIKLVNESLPQIPVDLNKSPVTNKTNTSEIIPNIQTENIVLSDSNSGMEIEIVETTENIVNDLISSTLKSQPTEINVNITSEEVPVEIISKNESIKLDTSDMPDNVEFFNLFILNNNKTVEPKLASFIISDKGKTFITDIKVFDNRLFVCGSHGILRQYIMDTHQCVMDYTGHRDLIHCILPTANKFGVKKLFSGGFDQCLLIHNIDTGIVLKKIAVDRPILSLCDERETVYFGTAGGMILIYSLTTDLKIGDIVASKSGISCMAITKDSARNLLLVGTNNGEYLVWDPIKFVKIKSITPVSHNEAPIGFIILQKQRLLAYTRNYVHFINYSKTKNSTSLNHFNSINSMCLTRNCAIFGGVSGNISVYKMKGSHIQKRHIQSIDNGTSPILSLTFYNNTIITGNKNGCVNFHRLMES